VHLQKGLIKGQEKLIAMYERSLPNNRKFSPLENEFRLRKEAESIIQRQIDELTRAACQRSVPQNKKRTGTDVAF